VSADAIYAAIGQLPSGAAIITARANAQATGMLASWIQQAAFTPPMISVAIRRGRYIEELIAASGRFAVNVLPEHPAAFLRHFARGFGPGEPAFAGLQTHDSAAGPLLTRCPAHLQCVVRERMVAGDHHLYLAEVLEGAVADDRAVYVHRRRTGAAY